MTEELKNLNIGNAKIVWRNFSGKEGTFNPPGRKNFCVFLEDDLAKALAQDGWNIRWTQSRADPETQQGYLQVSVSFDNYPPKIVMITSRGKTVLDDDTVNVLDWADIEKIDLIINPYPWVMHKGKPNQTSGIKAYLKSAYVVIAEDEFESQYYDVPESEVVNVGTSVCDECGMCDSKGECRHAD